MQIESISTRAKMQMAINDILVAITALDALEFKNPPIKVELDKVIRDMLVCTHGLVELSEFSTPE